MMLHTIIITILLLLHHVVSTTTIPCSNPLPGIAFDIDGVVRQGNRPCLEGLKAIITMQERKWPFIFLTNGGAGRTEEEYALKLTKMFMSSDVRTCTGTFDASPAAALADRKAALPLQKKLIPLKGIQFVLAYTPLSEMESMKQQRILAVGASGVERVARSYGYNNVLHVNEYARRHPEQSPWMTRWVSETPPGCPGLFGDENDRYGDGPFDNIYEKMDAIFVMSDPNFFGQALELCVDFLLSNTPNTVELSKKQPKIIFVNPDFLWKAEFSRPRLGLGAFKTSLIAVYKERLRGLGKTEKDIEERLRNRWLQLGKPMPSQYYFAEKKMDLLLEDEGSGGGGGGGGSGKNNDRCIDRFYMIGDNQNTDIKGEFFLISLLYIYIILQ